MPGRARSRLKLAAVVGTGGAAILAVALLWPRHHDYAVRVFDIPMRDGVTLHTLVLVPEHAAHRPILLSRTPFGAAGRVRLSAASLADAVMPIFAVAARAHDVLVFQDVRGRFGSGGVFDMLQPLAADAATRATDESTDAWDTVDFLVRHVPESNGRVGVIGFSYDGFTTLAALLHPHPAIRAAVAIDPLVDGWTGDDWFHHGAFRQVMIPFVQFMSGLPPASAGPDDYATLLQAGSTAAYGHSIGLDAVPAWQTLMHHPDDDEFWRGQAIDRRLAAEPHIVPTLFVASAWDAEDGYGAVHAYAAAAARPGAADTQHLVIGPWVHRQANGDGGQTGPLRWDHDTAARFRDTMLVPFLQAALDPAVPALPLPPVTAFETGDGGGWHSYASWPPSGGKAARFYLRAGFQLRTTPGGGAEAPFDAYVADPAKPVPFSPPPVQVASTIGANWPTWMLENQMAVAGRPDVLTYVSPPLDQPLHVAGAPVAALTASTSGTDADWVVKLLDIYPADAPQAVLRGYALPVSMDIFRARYRDDPAHPTPLPANQPVAYRFTLPTVSHVFEPGHRVAVQIQSSWFPLYDRNPQTYVANIFTAPVTVYVPATQRIYRGSVIELPLTGAQ